MKAVELRDLDPDELHEKLRELREELFNLRFQLATGQLDNHRRIRHVKRDVARVQTAMREHELALADEQIRAAAVPDAGRADAVEEASE